MSRLMLVVIFTWVVLTSLSPAHAEGHYRTQVIIEVYHLPTEGGRCNYVLAELAEDVRILVDYWFVENPELHVILSDWGLFDMSIPHAVEFEYGMHYPPGHFPCYQLSEERRITRTGSGEIHLIQHYYHTTHRIWMPLMMDNACFECASIPGGPEGTPQPRPPTPTP